MQHTGLEEGRWFELSLYEQMGNIGSEVGRVARAKKQGDTKAYNNALDRALELFRLTIADPNRKDQLKEILRSKEVFLDALLDKPEYKSNVDDIDRYFFNFALAARINR
jgi:hypothetical protein